MRKILLSLVFLSSFLYMRAQNAQSDALAKQLVNSNATAIGLSQDDLKSYIVNYSYYNDMRGSRRVGGEGEDAVAGRGERRVGR